MWRRHIDHLKLFEPRDALETSDQVEPEPAAEEESVPYTRLPDIPTLPPQPTPTATPVEPPTPLPPAPLPSAPDHHPRSFPSRQRNPPNWYGSVISH